MSNNLQKEALALLAMQRHSWEQGVAMQAFLENGEEELVELLAHEAVYRRLEDGRTAVLGDPQSVTDPCCVGEALLWACRRIRDPFLIQGQEALLKWALQDAPRNEKGVVYHLMDKRQFWVDSIYMLPPYLIAAGYVKEALINFYGYADCLYDREAHLMNHMWDDGRKEWVRKVHWGTGNGWTLAAIARMVPLLKAEGYEEDAQKLGDMARDILEHLMPLMREDGLFYDVVDDPETFAEVNLSQMTAYTIYRGATDGWLCPDGGSKLEKWLQTADGLRCAAAGRVNQYGFVEGVCGAPRFNKPGFSPEGQAFYLLMEGAAARAGR